MNYQKINKKNIEKWENTLKYLTHTLDINKISYYLSASGLHYIQGSNIYPYDIDLFLSQKDILKAFELLKEYTTSELHKWENKYLEFQGEYNGILFEICEWEAEPSKIKIKIFRDFKVLIIDQD